MLSSAPGKGGPPLVPGGQAADRTLARERTPVVCAAALRQEDPVEVVSSSKATFWSNAPCVRYAVDVVAWGA